MLTFTSIKEIQAWQFAGNHFSDMPAFNAIDTFVRDKRNSIADRAEALRVMTDKGMGCGRDEHLTDEAVMLLYLSECS